MIDLKKQFTAILTKLHSLDEKTRYKYTIIAADSGFSTTTFIARSYKVGPLAIVYMNILIPALTAGQEKTMFTIPSSAFRPSEKMNFTVNGQVNAMYLIQVYAEGRVSIYSNDATSQQFLRGSFVIPCSGGVNRQGINGFSISIKRRWAHADLQGFADEDAGKYKNVAVKHFHPSNKSFRPRNKGFHLGDECNYSVIWTDKNRQQCFFGDINSEYFRSIRSYQLQRGIEHTHGIQTCRSNSEADVKLRSLLLQLFHGFKHSSNCSADEGRWERFIDNPERISDLCKGITAIPREGVAA